MTRHHDRQSTGNRGIAGPSFAMLGLSLSVLAAACGSGRSPAGPSDAAGPQAMASPAVTPQASYAMTADLQEVLTAALQDEYHAEAVYQAVIEDFGSVWPFANVVRAEQAHAASVARLFANRGVTAPSSAWSPSNAPRFDSLAAACAAAADAERANVAIYDGPLATDLPLDVRTVFTNNRAASLEAHLPAFERCR
jgi:hypothetical protein